jgi:5-methylcytosine-specific restriction endonuclease McrA
VDISRRKTMAKSERKKLTEKLDKLCREIIRERDNHTCQRCLKYIEGSNSQPCHVVSKKNGASLRRFDLLNIFLGCNPCHRWWHAEPTESAKWFADRFPARDAYLSIYRGGKPARISTPEMKEMVEKYKTKLKDLTEN